MEKPVLIFTPVSTYFRYNHSLKGRIRRKKYRGSLKYDLVRKRYEQSAKGRETRQASSKRRYHEIQDEAGCYMKPRVFYPAFCLIKALANAEVVEV